MSGPVSGNGPPEGRELRDELLGFPGEPGHGVEGLPEAENRQKAGARRGPKSEIRNPKPQTNPKRQAENDENHCPPAGFEHWTSKSRS
jgi:hypothetical protein